MWPQREAQTELSVLVNVCQNGRDRNILEHGHRRRAAPVTVAAVSRGPTAVPGCVAAGAGAAGGLRAAGAAAPAAASPPGPPIVFGVPGAAAGPRAATASALLLTVAASPGVKQVQ